jgi:hypothetical protein
MELIHPPLLSRKRRELHNDRDQHKSRTKRGDSAASAYRKAVSASKQKIERYECRLRENPFPRNFAMFAVRGYQR